jgi:hypothetical protein
MHFGWLAVLSPENLQTRTKQCCLDPRALCDRENSLLLEGGLE